MSWHYLPELVADFSVADCSAGERSVPLNSTSTAEKSCFGGKETVCSTCARSGTTCEPSTADRGVASWMSSLPVSRASRSRVPGDSGPQPTNAICGRRRSESFVRWSRSGACWKTCLPLFPPDTWPLFSGTWPRAGSMQSGTCYPRPESERHISASGSGLLATPTATANQLCPSMQKWPSCRLWPTPLSHETGNRKTKYKQGGTPLSLAVNTWPTPLARDWKNSHVSQATLEKNSRPLNEVVSQGRGGKLNPMWVEWLMGWPLGFTDCAPLETDKYQQWLSKHGVNCP